MKLEIYDKVTRKRLNMIKVYSYVQYAQEYNSYGSFSIIMYPDDNVMKHIVFGNYILFDDGVIGIIKGVKNYEEDVLQIEITGFLSNFILTYRSFLLTTRYNDTVTNIILQMFKDLFIQSNRKERNIDFLKISEDKKYLPEIKDKIIVQNTGNNFLDVFNKKFNEYKLGVELYPVIENYDEEKGKTANLSYFEFRLSKVVDRTIDNQDGNKPILFSFELSNLSKLTYEEDGKEYASVVIVASEGVGQERKIIEIGDTESVGIDRIEFYVDARDLQSEEEVNVDPEDTNEPNENTNTISDKELIELMKQRGLEALSEHQKFISCEGTINTGGMSYEYGKDFYLGDIVSVYSQQLNIIVGLQIVSVIKSISDGVEYFDITFGYDRISIRKLRGE